MQLVNPIRRLAALLPLALSCVAVPGLAHAAQTQVANLVPVALLSTPGDLEDPPRQVRSDLLLADDGNIYFGSFAGGEGAGAIVRLAPDGTLTTVHALDGEDGDDGVNIIGPLMQASDRALYGTAFVGGEEGGGTLFRLTLDGTFSVLHHFGGGRPNAILPYTGVAEGSDGLLYGTTLNGGADNKGVIYRIARDGTGYTVVHEFSGGSGENPQGTLELGADGMLYGTTMLGGSSSRGTIYRISTSGAHEVIYSFPSLGNFNSQGLATNATGANPRAGLLLAADGNFYGTAYQGGENGHGTVYRLTPAGEVSVVHAFLGPSFGGSGPLAGVTQDAAGNFYGTTESGGYLHRGTAWRIATDGMFSVLHSFSGSPTDGATLYAGVLPANGTLYSATYTDASGGAGSIVRFDTGTGGVTPLTISASQTQITLGEKVTLTWNAPAGSTCTKVGGILSWTGETTVSGSVEVDPGPSSYAFGLSCQDPDDGVEATPRPVRLGYVGVVVNAPPLQPVDGGGGAGSLSLLWLLALGALLCSRFNKEKRSPCP